LSGLVKPEDRRLYLGSAVKTRPNHKTTQQIVGGESWESTEVRSGTLKKGDQRGKKAGGRSRENIRIFSNGKSRVV